MHTRGRRGPPLKDIFFVVQFSPTGALTKAVLLRQRCMCSAEDAMAKIHFASLPCGFPEYASDDTACVDELY